MAENATDDGASGTPVSDAPEPPPLGDLLTRVARAIHFQSRALMAPLGLTPASARALRTPTGRSACPTWPNGCTSSRAP